MSIDLKARLYEFYEAASAGNLDAFADMLDEDIDFTTNAPAEVFSYLGRRRGRAEVKEMLRAVHNEFESMTFLPLSLVIEGEAASALVSVQGTQRATGASIQFFAAHFIRFRDGLVVEYRSVIDTFEAAKQVFGRAFDD
jgi:ketosteroid isomerase-like protein